MKHINARLLNAALAVSLTSLFPSITLKAETSQPLDSIKGFLVTYCTQCHGSEKPKGEVRLDDFSEERWNRAEEVSRILEVLQNGDMPSSSAKAKLSDVKRQQVVDRLKQQVVRLDSKRSYGVLKRLNRHEYQNTIHDIFGVQIDILNDLPADSTGDEFDKVGNKLVVTPLSMVTYSKIAAIVAEQVISPVYPNVKEHVYAGPEGIRQSNAGSFNKQGVFLYSNTEQGSRVSPRHAVTVEGDYHLSVDGYFTRRETTKHHKVVEELLEADILPRDKTKMSFGSGDYLKPDWVDRKEPLPFDSPKVFHLRPGESIVLRYWEKIRLHGWQSDTFVLNLKSITVKGPFNPAWPPASHQRIFGSMKNTEGWDSCKQAIDKLALNVFRRPVSAKVMNSLYGVAKRELADSKNLYKSVQTTLKVMLSSPYFLYKLEGSENELDDFAIASRLSYFFWNSCPDDRLLQLAAEGKLQNADVRVAEAKRLLADEKVKRLTYRFTQQWLELDKLGNIVPHEVFLTKGDKDLLWDSIAEEPSAFVHTLLRENLSLTNIIDSEFVVADPSLAHRHYGVRYPHEGQLFRRLAKRSGVDKHGKRNVQGGLLTQPVFHLITSDGIETSPILRGVWVLKNLYGLEFVPPGNVPAIKPAKLNDEMTIKERVLEHRKNANCARCHDKIDPIGMALEHFDVRGHWRDKYALPKLKVEISTKNGKESRSESWQRIERQTIDATADYVHGNKIKGYEGLRDLMAKDRDIIMKAVFEKLIAYAKGRKSRISDEKQLLVMCDEAKSLDYKLKDMMLIFVASKSFARR
jgi:hypothetical protein